MSITEKNYDMLADYDTDEHCEYVENLDDDALMGHFELIVIKAAELAVAGRSIGLEPSRVRGHRHVILNNDYTSLRIKSFDFKREIHKRMHERFPRSKKRHEGLMDVKLDWEYDSETGYYSAYYAGRKYQINYTINNDWLCTDITEKERRGYGVIRTGIRGTNEMDAMDALKNVLEYISDVYADHYHLWMENKDGSRSRQHTPIYNTRRDAERARLNQPLLGTVTVEPCTIKDSKRETAEQQRIWNHIHAGAVE